MTEKLKVSQEVADAIEAARKDMSDESLLTHHAEGYVTSESFWAAKEIAPLNRLNPYRLATALIVGYEVEKTPHEEIAAEYNKIRFELNSEEIIRGFPKNEVATAKREGFLKGVDFTLNALKEVVQGVNDK